MKITFNLNERQLQKALILLGAKDSEIDEVFNVLPKYQELDITDFIVKNDEDDCLHLTLASFAVGAIAQLEDK